MSDQLVKDRTAGIGGSDIAPILGRGKFGRTAFTTYLEKIGQADPVDETEPMEWGNILEDPVARKYARETGNKIARVNKTLRHPEHPCLMAHIDRRVIHQKGQPKRILEVKTSGRWGWRDWGPAGGDDVPESILLQCHHYLGITGAEVCDVAALIAGNDFRIYHVYRDDRLIEFLVREGVRFWDEHVMTETPPSVVSLAEVRKRYREAVGKMVCADDDLVALVEEWAQADAAAKHFKETVDALKYAVAMHMVDVTDPNACVEQIVNDKFEALVTFKGHDQTKFDEAACAAEMPALHRKFKKTIRVRPIKLTKAGRALAATQTEEADGNREEERTAAAAG